MSLKKNYFFFYIFLYLSLVVGFIFGENSSGGAIYDFNIIIKAIESFSNDLKNTYENYSSFSIAHYPYYYIFLSFLLKLTNSIVFVKLFNLHLSLLLPLVFYKILRLKYPNQLEYLIFLPGLIFLSPYFRSSAIWALNDNIALVFFSFAIFYYLKTIFTKKEHKIFKYAILNLIFIIGATYIRQYYSIFGIFFLYNYFLKTNYRVVTSYCIFGFLLTLPIFLQFFDANLNYAFNFFSHNLINNFVLLITIFVVYLIPFYIDLNKIKQLTTYFKEKFFLILIIFLFVCLISYFFDYHATFVDTKKMGGGIIYKLFFNENIYFLFFSILFFSILIIVHFCDLDLFKNLTIISFIFLMFPMGYVFQKYLDPLSLIIIFSLLRSEILNKFIKNLHFNIYILYLYFMIIYLSSLFRYYLI